MPQGKSALGIVQKYHPGVTRVVDAKRAAVIQVTKANCKSGNKKSASSCAMARAFEREHDGAIISLSCAYIVDGKKATRYKVPPAVSREIVSFDRHGDFAPGIYKLNAPGKWNKLGKSPTADHRRRHDANKTKRHKPNHHTAGIRSL